MGGISEHFLELNTVTVSTRLAVGVFARDRPTLLCAELAKLRELVFDFLAFVSGANTSIDRDSRFRLQFSHRIGTSGAERRRSKKRCRRTPVRLLEVLRAASYAKQNEGARKVVHFRKRIQNFSRKFCAAFPGG